MPPELLAFVVAWVALGPAPGSSVDGTVAGPEGQPVGGASVWLLDPGGPGEAPFRADARSDGEGRFAIPRPAVASGQRTERVGTLWAYRAGYRAAVAAFPDALPEGPIRLTLGPAGGASFRIEGAAREPIGSARVRVTLLQRDFRAVPSDLAQQAEVTTDGQGRAEVDAFAPEEIAGIEIRADGYGTQPHHFVPPAPGPRAIRLRAVGRVSGRLVANDPAAVRGWSVFAATIPDDDPTYRGSWAGIGRATTDDQGRFDIPALASGRLTVTLTPPDGSGYRPEPGHDSQRILKAGGTTDVEIGLKKSVKVEGLVRERGTGKPVFGAVVTVMTPSSATRGYPVRSDAQGRYTFHSLPGKASIRVSDMPRAFVRSPDLILRDLTVPEGAERFALPPIEPERGAELRGMVVDEEGRPVARATVSGEWGMSGPGGSLRAVVGATSGGDGTFTIEGIYPGAEVAALSARRHDRATTSSPQARAGQAEPVTLRISEAGTLAATGRAIGPGGEPVAGALVTITHRTPYAGGNGTFGGPVQFDDAAEVRTGTDGSYRTPKELRPGIQYQAAVTAAGTPPARTPFVRSGAGATMAFPVVVLSRPDRERAIAGRVVDRRGEPLAGAVVFSSGDGPGRGRLVTDANGRFQIAGVAGSVLVFAEAPGFGLSGRVAAAGPVEVILDRIDERPPRAKPVPAAVPPRADEKRLAESLLKPVFPKVLTWGGDLLRAEAIEALALAAPERVAALVQEQIVAADEKTVAAVALGLAEDDTAASRQAIASVTYPSIAASAALAAVDARPAADPAWRRGLLELALDRARDVADRSQSIVLMAGVADRMLASGNRERGTAAVREVETLVASQPQSGGLYPRGDLAEALARLDLPAALKLIGPPKTESYNDRSIYGGVFSNVAVRIAATNPAEAERLYGLVRGEGSMAGRSLVPLCARMAPADLPRAHRLAVSAEGPASRATALGAMASALAKTDLRQARDLLDEAFALLTGAGPGHADEMAWLLPVAQRIDPEGVPGYLWRCLAMHAKVSTSTKDDLIRDRAVIAALVAPYDRDAAAVVFEPVAAELPGLIAGASRDVGYSLRVAILATAVYDPRAAIELVRRVPDGNDGPGRPGIAVRVAAAEMIAVPPAIRLRELARRQFLPWLADLSD